MRMVEKNKNYQIQTRSQERWISIKQKKHAPSHAGKMYPSQRFCKLVESGFTDNLILFYLTGASRLQVPNQGRTKLEFIRLNVGAEEEYTKISLGRSSPELLTNPFCFYLPEKEIFLNNFYGTFLFLCSTSLITLAAYCDVHNFPLNSDDNNLKLA